MRKSHIDKLSAKLKPLDGQFEFNPSNKSLEVGVAQGGSGGLLYPNSLLVGITSYNTSGAKFTSAITSVVNTDERKDILLYNKQAPN